jgi:hypothetical protein
LNFFSDSESCFSVSHVADVNINKHEDIPSRSFFFFSPPCQKTFCGLLLLLLFFCGGDRWGERIKNVDSPASLSLITKKIPKNENSRLLYYYRVFLLSILL